MRVFRCIMARLPLPPHKLPAAFALLAAAVLGGAAVGETVGTSPVLARRDAATTPISDYRPGEVYERAQAAQPDQYAITTPQGRFEVSELAQRGLYSQARFGPYGMADMDQVLEMEAAIARDLAAWDAGETPDRARYASARDEQDETTETVDEAPPQLEPLPVLALGD